MVLTEEEKRERNRINQKKYRESEAGKLSKKKYDNSQKCKDYQKKYKELGKYNENCKKYRNTEKGKIKKEEYITSEKGKKNSKKSSWKSQGVKLDNFDELYERYINAIFCDICECVLDNDITSRKCLDHDHDTGDFRNIVCWSCNIYICK